MFFDWVWEYIKKSSIILCDDKAASQHSNNLQTQNLIQITPKWLWSVCVSHVRPSFDLSGTGGDTTPPTSLGSPGSDQPSLVAKVHVMGPIGSSVGPEGRQAVMGHMTWYSIIRHHDNLATMLLIQQLYELERGGNKCLVENNSYVYYVFGNKLYKLCMK